MTLGTVAADGASPSAARCSCCGAQMGSYYRDQAPEEESVERLISESFLTANGGALYLPRRNSSTANDVPHTSTTSSSSSQRRNKQSGNLPKHLHTMLTVLRPEDTIRLAVRLEGATPQVARYMVVVSTSGRQDTEESALLGMDFASNDSCCTVGLVLPLWSDTMIHLDGDGGFTVSTVNRVHVFKPVSVQAMWSALQSLHKACEVARRHNYYPGSLALTWVGYYHRSISSSQVCINEWNALQDVEPNFAKASLSSNQLPTERENMERLIRKKLRDIMMQKDLESVTCKEIRTELELQMVCDLAEFKKFIGNEMIVILGQMDSPTEVFEHVYLGSEWNASNLDELQTSGVRYILNVTREIDNFFPGLFEYHNIRVYDEEATNLLEYWNDTYKFISKAKKAGSKCLVHCKMGISRSASTVIAYAMKEYGWDLDTAFEHVKERRSVTQPNPAFMKQLEEYQGILLASKQRHNKLWRSHSDFQLAPRPQSTGKPTSFTSSSSSSSSSSSPPLGRSDHCSSNSSSSSSSSLNQLLNLAVLQVLTTTSETQSPTPPEHRGSTPPEHRGSTPPEHRGPTPRPQAATLVLGEQLSSEASVAVTMPVAVHHVPASTSEPSLLTLDPLFFSTSDPLILTNDIPLLTSEPHPSIPDHLQLTPKPEPSTLDSPTSEPSLSLTPDPPSLTFEPPASLTPDLPPLTSEPPLSSTFEPPPLISDPQLLIFDALSLNPAISHLTFEPPTSEPPLSSTPDPPPLTFELPVSLTPKPPPLTFKPPVSLTLDLPPLTFEPPISLTPDPPHLTSDPQLLILEPQIFSTSDPEPAIPDHLLLTPDPKPSTLDPLTTEPLPPLTPEPPPLTSHPQCGQSSAEHTDMSPVSSEKSRPEEGGVTLSCWQSQSPWLPELFERSDLLLDRSFLHSHDIAPFNQTSPSPTGGNGAHTNDICQTREAFVGQDPSWSRHSHQRAPQSTRQEKSEEVEEKEEESAEEEEEEEEGLQSTQHCGASEPTLTSISWLSAPHFVTEVEAVQQPPTSPASPRCSTGWVEPLSPDCVGKAPLTTTTTDEDVDDYDDGGGSGHVLPASELKESNSHTLGWRPSNVTLNGVTLQESDTGGALVPQLWGPSPSVDSHELETFPPEDLSPTVERREQETFAFGHVSPQAADPQDLEHFPCQGLSPSVDGWRGRGEDQKGLTPAVVGLGVRLRQAGLTPPSLLKRSASLAKLDHLQLSTLDLSDLDPRSSRRLGGTEPR